MRVSSYQEEEGGKSSKKGILALFEKRLRGDLLFFNFFLNFLKEIYWKYEKKIKLVITGIDLKKIKKIFKKASAFLKTYFYVILSNFFV